MRYDRREHLTCRPWLYSLFAALPVTENDFQSIAEALDRFSWYHRSETEDRKETRIVTGTEAKATIKQVLAAADKLRGLIEENPQVSSLICGNAEALPVELAALSQRANQELSRMVPNDPAARKGSLIVEGRRNFIRVLFNSYVRAGGNVDGIADINTWPDSENCSPFLMAVRDSIYNEVGQTYDLKTLADDLNAVSE